MDIKTLTGTIPRGRVQVFKELDKQLKQIDDEATNLRLELQAEVEAMKKEVADATKRQARKEAAMNLVTEKCEMIKPVLQEILINYGDEMNPANVRKIEDFLNFSLPEDTSGDKPFSYQGMDLQQLKEMLAKGMDTAGNVASSAAAAAAAAAARTAGALDQLDAAAGTAPTRDSKSNGLGILLGEGEFPFTDEIDTSKEIEHWGAALEPETQNTINLIRDPNNQDRVIPTGYKFNIRYDQLAQGQVPTFHIDLDDDYQPTIIRFHAGKPYQDKAYRISPLSWYQNSELGFVNKFEDGLYKLHFNLKRK